MKLRALVLSGYGINCERETAEAARLAGFETDIVHAKAWLLGQVRLADYQFLIFPGGFSFGDELGAGKAFANRILFSQKHEEVLSFVDKGGCILGVCNGFQILVKLGFFPDSALTCNEKGRFEARWVHQKVLPSPCIFTRGIEELYLPIRHGEGNFSFRSPVHATLQYTSPNPNGSMEAISAVSDKTGRVLGMMPHPEAALFFTQLPDWTRRAEEYRRNSLPLPEYGPGFALFQNAVRHFS